MKHTLVLLMCLVSMTVAHAYAPIGQILPYNERNDIQLTVGRYAFVYGVSESVLFSVLNCESRMNPRAINTKEVHGESVGIAQFRRSTFDEWSVKAGIQNGDPYNYDDAIKTTAYMISAGKGGHWSCFRRLSTLE